MDINYDRYETSIVCDDNSCSLRYKLSGDTLAVYRYTYSFVRGKKLTQKIVILKEVDNERLIKDIMFDMGFSPELGEVVVTSVRERSYIMIYNHI